MWLTNDNPSRIDIELLFNIYQEGYNARQTHMGIGAIGQTIVQPRTLIVKLRISENETRKKNHRASQSVISD